MMPNQKNLKMPAPRPRIHRPFSVDEAVPSVQTSDPCSKESVPNAWVANLTLSIGDALLQKAREAAVREHTTVTALVRAFLNRYVDARSRRLEALDRFEAVAASSQSASSTPWSRDELYERS